MATEAQNSPFIKHLASSDKKTRDQALTSLRTYLSTQTSIPELDLLKLWKGLFYCLWMQDKPLSQQRLSRDLASLLDALQRPLVLPFLDAFWTTMSREWGGIEALRMDKFLFLVRQYLNKSFGFLSQGKWKDGEARKEYVRILEKGPMNAENVKVPNGLRYHLLDIYVDELEKVGGQDWDVEVLEGLLEPVRKLAKESPTKTVRKVAREALEDQRLKVWRGEEVEKKDEEMGERSEEEWGGIED